jgi:hypothetical protein
MSAMSDADLRAYNAARLFPYLHSGEFPLFLGATQTHTDNTIHSGLLNALDRYVKLHTMCVENGLIPEDEEYIGMMLASISNSLLEQRDALYSRILRKLDHLRKPSLFGGAVNMNGMQLAYQQLFAIESHFNKNVSIFASYRPINTESTSEITPLDDLLTQVELVVNEEYKRLAKRHLDTATSLIDDLLTIVSDYSD